LIVAEDVLCGTMDADDVTSEACLGAGLLPSSDGAKAKVGSGAR